MKRLILLALVIAGVGLAQNSGDRERERVRAELERTDAMLTEAEPRIRNSAVPEAVAKFEEARTVQQTARGDFQSNRLRMALGRTMRAREMLRAALQLVQIDPERIRTMVRTTRERMSEIGPAVLRAGIPRALELWRSAEAEQATAERSVTAGRWAMALKFARTARDHALAAWRLTVGPAGPERVQAAVERTARLMESVAAPVATSGNARATALLERAGNWLNEARRLLARRENALSLRRTLAARDLALRAWELVRGPTDAAMTDRVITETERLLAEWADDIAASDRPEPKLLLEQCRRRLALAREHAAAGRHAEAWRTATEARRALDQALSLIESGQ